MGKFALLLFMTAVGFLSSPWLRKSYPWTVHGIVSGIAFCAVFALIYFAGDAAQTITTELTFASPLTALGSIPGAVIALFLANGSDDPAPAKLAKEKTEAMHERLTDIIKGAKPNEHNGHQARAFSNRRLEVAFRVNNCFTAAMEKKQCDKVRDDVLELLQPAKPGVTGRWRD